VIDTTESAVSTVVAEQIDSLPTNGRNFLSFSVITPGDERSYAAAGRPATSGSFGGQRGRTSWSTASTTTIRSSAGRATFSQEAIQNSGADQFLPGIREGIRRRGQHHHAPERTRRWETPSSSSR
jgi:hypothetical protein